MNINIDVTGDVDLSTVVDSAYVQTGEESWREEGVTLGHLVARELADRIMRTDYGAELRRKVNQVRDEVIHEKIVPVIEEAFTNQIQKTNAFGEPISGQTLTMNELIVQSAQNWMTKGDGYGRDRVTNIAKLISQEVDVALKKEMKNALDTAKKEVTDAVAAKASELFAQIIADGIGGRR